MSGFGRGSETLRNVSGCGCRLIREDVIAQLQEVVCEANTLLTTPAGDHLINDLQSQDELYALEELASMLIELSVDADPSAYVLRWTERAMGRLAIHRDPGA
jgi:hypothetical protein